MAVSGGATSAYRCQVRDNELWAQKTTTLRQLCASVSMAVAALSKGEEVTVQGAEMTQLREQLRGHGVLV